MSGGFIQPTVTQRVRSFLTRSAVDVRPWAGLAATYEALYALFRQRREDPAFWGSLTDLMHEIVDGVVEAQEPGRLPAPQAELLSSWDVDELVHKLRTALGEAEDDGSRGSGRPAWSVFSARLSPAVLGGFLLGIVENLGIWKISAGWKDTIAFGLLIFFLLVWPSGILGRRVTGERV